jgi:UDP-glucose 4-epimerase
VETAREVTGRGIEAAQVPRRAEDPAVLVASNQKIQEELGWAPKKPELKAMISDAWEWMQAHLCGYRSKSSPVVTKAPQRRSRRGA